MNNSTNQINGVIRGVAAAGGGGMACASHDELIQIVGALVTLLSIVWSVIEKRRASRTGPPAGGAVLALATGALLLGGCQTMSPDQKLTLVQTVATEAAYVGAAYDLGENPAHRPAYVAAVAALAAIVEREAYDPANLRAALNGLPALRGGTGAILDSGITLYSVAAGFVDLTEAPYVRAAALGIKGGLERALARPTGTATRALAPALPVQCTVPQR